MSWLLTTVLVLLLLTDYINSQTVPCSNEGDCSYNGICKNSVCECFPQWKGGHCASLNLIAGSKTAGLRSTVNGSRTTSWGGGIVYDNKTNLYHMIAAEMQYSCGMTVWLSNSQIVHATSKTFDGEYTRKEVVKGGALFSHEPNIVKALDTGEYVVYYTHNYPPATYKYPCEKCKNGETDNCPTDGNKDYARNWNVALPTKMIYTSDISNNSKWSEIINLDGLVTPNQFVDSNLACYIFPNGSLIGIARNDNANMALQYNLIKATNWKINKTYSYHAMHPYDNNSGREVAQYGEDPFVWYDTRYDIVHTIWHYTYNGDTPNGLHAFSQDGGTTFHAFLDFGDTQNGDYPAEWAYTGDVIYSDGSTETLDTAERPHLLLAEDGYTPLALTNGVRPPNNADYSFTLLRPIAQK